MVKNVKYGKIAAVVFLSLLVWVWADLAKTEVLSVPKADLAVAKSVSPNLWVTFDNTRASVSITKLVLKGPTSKINQLKAQIDRRLHYPRIPAGNRAVRDDCAGTIYFERARFP